jgi:K+-transporting ATPase A subunit
LETISLGNFYKDFVRSLTRILLPLSMIVAILFAFTGMPMTFRGPDKIRGLSGFCHSCDHRSPASHGFRLLHRGIPKVKAI